MFGCNYTFIGRSWLRGERPHLVTSWKATTRYRPRKRRNGALSYRESAATKSIVWWNVCVQPQKGTAEVRVSKPERKTQLNSIKTASVDRLKSLHDGYHWWRFRILRLRPGLKPSTVLFLRVRNSSLWFSSGQTHHVRSSRWITEHQFSPCARRQTATGTERLKSCRDLWHLKHDRLWSNWRKKKFTFVFKIRKKFCSSNHMP